MIPIPLVAKALPWRLIACIGGLAVIVGGAWWWSEHEREAGRLEERDGWQRKEAIEAAEATVRRVEVGKRHQEIIDEARENVAKANLERDVAAAGGQRLRQQFAAGLQTRCLATAAGASAPDGDPIGVFAEVFGRIEGAAERYAAEADANRIAGLACERAYNALSADASKDGGRLDR